LVVVLAALLAGCMSTSQPVRTIQGAWVRSDGQSGRDNPALAAQFAADKAACTQPGAAEPDRACMDQRGYLLVPESQAAAKAAELRAAKAAVQGGGI
jgi:hypothetical protein